MSWRRLKNLRRRLPFRPHNCVSSEALERLRAWGAEVAIVLGSGLSALADSAQEQIAYSVFPDIPAPSVQGHLGRFLRGSVGNARVIYAQGRSHLYEGHSAVDVTAGVRILQAAGIKRLILTNAAGSTNPEFSPGSWMMVTDHLNLTGTSPLVGQAGFVDMSEIYSAPWRAVFRRTADSLGLILHAGVYAGVLGPQYETAAEVRMLRGLGADAIGMSTVLEAIQARALGLEVAGFSCLTNFAAGLTERTLNHQEVLTTGEAAATHFAELLRAAL